MSERYQDRLESIRIWMSEKDVTTSVVFLPDHQFYLTNFKALTYSRPIVLLIDKEKTALVVPGLEEVHANHVSTIDQVAVYYETDQHQNEATSLYKRLREVLKDFDCNKVAIDEQNAPIMFLRHFVPVGSETVDLSAKLVEMRYIKSTEEIDEIKKTGVWINEAVNKSYEACAIGVTELEVDGAGNTYLFENLPTHFPDATIAAHGMSPAGPVRSVMPHVFSSSKRIEEGDVLIHTRQLAINGYRSELERTFIIGEPTSEQADAFNAMLDAQTAAIHLLKPGIKAYEVDQVATSLLKERGYGEAIVHRTGHGIGISPHEEPYLRFDNDLVLQEGMVFTIEPGIYIKGLGGFRHSDTVVITKQGFDWVTDYPRDLESMTVKL
ncbi:hypothetical protein DH09_14070 [Bacillaceae bacterium JMAK1]|nr:hypothetical protein DH09_14070 [Bacillaceae bacterium JMAK1]